jgi:hypothetical protein
MKYVWGGLSMFFGIVCLLAAVLWQDGVMAWNFGMGAVLWLIMAKLEIIEERL